MKTRRSLPDIDLARITVMPPDQQRAVLAKMKLSYAPFTYNPTRNQILGILNAQVNPLMPLPRTPWEEIKAYIVRKCATNEQGLKANTEVSKALYDFSVENDITGLKRDFLDFSITAADKVRYWSPIVMNLGGRPTVPFIDPRRTKGLTNEGRRFVLSVMHERIRLLDPDLSDCVLAIIQFSYFGNCRVVKRPYFDSDVELFDFDQIIKMASKTYSLWEDILAERDGEIKRRSGGISGPLI